jgi:3-hydroxybutyryl-CoA dehydrogenase
MSPPRKIAVLGAGTMGAGIAQLAAQSGIDTTLFDVAPEPLARGLDRARDGIRKGHEKGKLTAAERDAALTRLTGATDLADAVRGAGLIVEAAPEQIALKQDLFRRVEPLADADAVLASNTSGLSVTAIAEACARPERVLGMHFFNPPVVMKLVELVRGERTSEDALSAAHAATEAMGREVIVVRDSPGFASSRLGVALALEAMRMLESGVASAQDIDRAMELGYGHPMGPLKLTDHVGLDVRLAIAEHLARELGDRFQPPEILRRLVRDGKLGKKSGEGFYRW